MKCFIICTPQKKLLGRPDQVELDKQGTIAYGKQDNCIQISVGEPRSRWEDNIKMCYNRSLPPGAMLYIDILCVN
jgi:hypothetical protein